MNEIMTLSWSGSRSREGRNEGCSTSAATATETPTTTERSTMKILFSSSRRIGSCSGRRRGGGLCLFFLLLLALALPSIGSGGSGSSSTAEVLQAETAEEDGENNPGALGQRQQQQQQQPETRKARSTSSWREGRRRRRQLQQQQQRREDERKLRWKKKDGTTTTTTSTTTTSSPAVRDIAAKSLSSDAGGGRGLLRLEYVAPDGAYDLGECQGDCDSGGDCRGGLVCFQRGGYEPVPGCSGSGVAGADYCYDPSRSSAVSSRTAAPFFRGSGNGNINNNGDVFRLKLYWEQGYDWQYQPYEISMCLECRYGCGWGKEVEVHQCNSQYNAYWQFNNKAGRDGGTQIQLYQSDLCMELVGSWKIELRNCIRSRSIAQTFWPGKGDFGGQRFELVTSNGRCLTIDHHPRSGEPIFGNSCSYVRSKGIETSYWNKY